MVKVLHYLVTYVMFMKSIESQCYHVTRTSSFFHTFEVYLSSFLNALNLGEVFLLSHPN
jgi:hypothetical protein